MRMVAGYGKATARSLDMVKLGSPTIPTQSTDCHIKSTRVLSINGSKYYTRAMLGIVLTLIIYF